ncbi:serine hydrolase domain-containing protein [Sphingomonas sp. DT-207]
MRRKPRLTAVLGFILVAGATATLGITSSKPASPDEHAMPLEKGQPADPASDGGPSRVDYRRLEERIARLMQEPEMVGLAVGTVERGQIRFLRGYGETLTGSHEPVTPDTVFRWASLSKSVASALITALAAEGRLSLDTPLATMGTTLTLPGGVGRATVADLLSHRLGLVRNAWDDRLEAGEDPKLLRAALGTLPAYCPPASFYAYQNIAYDAATEVVERVTGQGYARVAQARLFAPLGMTSASVGRAGLEGSASWARPHHHGKTPTTVDDSYYRVPAAGGVNSSIRDLVLWMRAQLGEAPQVLSAQALEVMHRPRVSTPPRGRRGSMDLALTNAAYGLGWRSFTYTGHALVGHRGSVNGYGSLILFVPADKSGIVMLWNSNQYKAARLQLEFFDMLYGLPAKDWLELQTPPVARDTAAAEAGGREKTR